MLLEVAKLIFTSDTTEEQEATFRPLLGTDNKNKTAGW